MLLILKALAYTKRFPTLIVAGFVVDLETPRDCFLPPQCPVPFTPRSILRPPL